MKLNSAIDTFLKYCKSEKNFSDKTLISYSKALSQFAEYFDEEYQVDPDVEKIETDDVRPFLGWLHDKGLKKVSLKQKISAVKSFFKYLVKRDLIYSNPTTSVFSPKSEKKLPSFLTKSDIDKRKTFYYKK